MYPFSTSTPLHHTNWKAHIEEPKVHRVNTCKIDHGNNIVWIREQVTKYTIKQGDARMTYDRYLRVTQDRLQRLQIGCAMQEPMTTSI